MTATIEEPARAGDGEVPVPARRAVAAEWSKAVANRSTWWAYGILAGLVVGFSAFMATASRTEPPGGFGDEDIVANALGGAIVGVIAAAVIGATSLGSEYGSGMISATFAATPRRHRVLLAKAAIVGTGTTVVAIPAVFVGFLVARPVQRDRGFVAPGYPDPHVMSEPVLRAIVGTGVLLGLVALLALGVAAIVQRTAAAIPITIGLVVVPAMLAQGELEATLQRWTPLAGFAIQHTRDRHDYHAGPWHGLAVLATYALLALAAGLVTLRRRDVTG